MTLVAARIGRERQRYENNFRLVSGCIPYRVKNGDGGKSTCLESTLEVLMVSSPNRNDMVFPKGGWEDDETLAEAACREALEEAGVRGILGEIPLGVWEFRSKSSVELCSLKGGCKGYMFALQVTEELETWPEQKNRDRKWLNINEAFQLCRYEWMRRALDEFLRVMGEDREVEVNKERMDESPSIGIADGVMDRQIMAANCYSRSQEHSSSVTSKVTWYIPLKRLSWT